MVDFPRDGTISTARIAELLAPTLGWEKSSEVADAAATRLGFSWSSLTMTQTLAILDDLARMPGMVGIAARFARSRLGASPKPATQRPLAPEASTMGGEPPKPPERKDSASLRSAEPSSEGLPASGPVSVRGPGSSPRSGQRHDDPGHAPSPPSAQTVTADDIAALFAGAMGAEKALDVVQGAARRLGLDVHRFDKGRALALLDHLAAEPGVVGLCARFGKARLILRFAA